MNKFVSILVLGSAMALSACGGDSDSSGSNRVDDTPLELRGLLACETEGKNIIARTFRACSVIKPDLNKGKIFSLKCNTQGTRIDIKAAENADITGIKDDIELNPLGKYTYECKNIGIS